MAPALEVADIFRRHGEAFRQARDGHLGGVERRVMGAITACRTAALGGHVEQCDDCGTTRIAYNSCRNRHCPKCQGLARLQWLAARQAELLAVPYFHVVFTLPAPVGAIAFQNKAAVYAILFRAAAETLTTIAADPKHLGAQIGVTAVLHTWGQTLQHHPHIHCVVPGGGPSLDGMRWVACRPGFFLPVRVLSRLFRRLFLQELKNAFDAGKLRFFSSLAHLTEPAAFAERLDQLRRVDWVVYAKAPFGGPEQVLAYLGRYTHRVAIANSRLISLFDGTSAASCCTPCRTASIASATTAFSPMAGAATMSPSAAGCSMPVTLRSIPSGRPVTPKAIDYSTHVTSSSASIAAAPCGGSQLCHAPPTISRSAVTRHDIIACCRRHHCRGYRANCRQADSHADRLP
jgi:hypothetical protein